VRLAPDASTTIPGAPHAHVFVAAGTVALAGSGDLLVGEAARAIEAGPLEMAAEPEGTEVLAWTTA